MRLGKNQQCILNKLRKKSPRTATAGEMSGSDMTDQAAATACRSLERKGLIRRAGQEAPGGQIVTWGTPWRLEK